VDALKVHLYLKLKNGGRSTGRTRSESAQRPPPKEDKPELVLDLHVVTAARPYERSILKAEVDV
jgi:hypothetical protein